MPQQATRAAMAGLVAASLSGCVVNIADDSPGRSEAAAPPPAAMVCNAAQAQHYVGQDATQTIGQAILKDSGARTLRWGPPNGAWTMDYRQDRVNVRYDERMKIVGITCG
jgi:hypothetical protein